MKRLVLSLLLISLICLIINIVFIVLYIVSKGHSSEASFGLTFIGIFSLIGAGLAATIHTGQLGHYGWMTTIVMSMLIVIPLPFMLVIYLIAGPNTPALQQTQSQYPYPMPIPPQFPVQTPNQPPVIFCHACGRANSLGQATCLYCGRPLPTTL